MQVSFWELPDSWLLAFYLISITNLKSPTPFSFIKKGNSSKSNMDQLTWVVQNHILVWEDLLERKARYYELQQFLKLFSCCHRVHVSRNINTSWSFDMRICYVLQNWIKLRFFRTKLYSHQSQRNSNCHLPSSK